MWNRDITQLSPIFSKKVRLFLLAVSDKVFVTDWNRTQEEQNKLYAQWRTTSGPIVTWTLNSNHIWGNAIDIAFKWGELYPSDFARWREIADIAKNYEIDWGYDLWKIDKPHFQNNNNELYAPDIFKGVNIVYKKMIKKRPKRLWAFNPYTNVISIYPRAFRKTREEFGILLMHEWSHKVYWKEFTREEVRAWEAMSRQEERVLSGMKNKKSIWNNIRYWTNKYISPGETNESEDFAETIEDICRNPHNIYNDFRDTKRYAAKKLMERHGYKI